MIKSIRRLKQEMDKRVKQDEIKRDEEGRAVIEVTVQHDGDFLSDYSVERPEISPALSEFLHGQTMAIPPREPVCLHIHSDCIDAEEQNVYRGALKEYAKRHYLQSRRKLKRNAIISAIMLAVGVIGLTAVVLISYLASNAVLAEVIDIFAWVFVWEAVDLFFLERHLIRGELYRALRLFDAPLKFLPVTVH